MATAHQRPEITWRVDILPRATRRALDFLSQQAWARRSRWYLAGGTALALHVGHRSSVDLDFFTPSPTFSASALMRRFPRGAWRTARLTEGTLYGSLFGAKVSFITYPYFRPRETYHRYGTVRVLDPRDIATMKVIAISQRGRKRDFADLYWYCRYRESLGVIVRRVPAQYPGGSPGYHHLLKSLTYFADAEADPLPKRWFDAAWEEIKAYFEREVPKLARELLGLR